MEMKIGIALVVLVVLWLIFKPKKKSDTVAKTANSTAGTAAVVGSATDAIIAATAAAIAAREDEIVAVISAALAFHGVSGGDRIVAVRPLGNKEWKLDSRISAVRQRDQMF